MNEERKKSYMTGSKTVNVKKKCRLGGLGNTSVACNQGDINNLEFGSVNEEITLDSGFVDGWNRYSVNNDGVEVGEIEVSNRDRYMILNKILIYPEQRQRGYADEVMKLLFDYANQNNKIIALTPDNIWGASKEKLKNWYI
jgi:predicted GNAT family acetyltransferase